MKIYALAISITSTFALPITNNGPPVAADAQYKLGHAETAPSFTGQNEGVVVPGVVVPNPSNNAHWIEHQLALNQAKQAAQAHLNELMANGGTAGNFWQSLPFGRR